MTGPVAGVLVAFIVDVVLPFALVALVLRRVPRSGRAYWIGTAVYLALVAVIVWRGLVDVIDYQGGGVVAATVTALPTSMVPFVVNSGVIHFFFTDREWAQGGYHAVLISYVAGMLGWALLNSALLRAAIVAGRREYGRQELRAHRREDDAPPSDPAILGL